MILVTGACGYIGSHTIVDLLENGYKVISIDNFSNSFPSSLDNIEKITGQRIVNYNIDLCDLEELKKVFQENKITGIIHFAALKAVNDSVREPLRYYRNNILGLLNMLECCKTYNIESFVFSSSCSVYGNAEILPVTENSPLAETESPYAETKLMAERIIKDYNKVNKTKFCILRYFNPIGAHVSGMLGENPIGEVQNVIPRMVGAITGKYGTFKIWGKDYNTKDGTCIRDYIHVSDIAHGHTLSIKWLSKQKEGAIDVFNMGSGQGVSVLELIHAFSEGTQQEFNYTVCERREGDVIAIYADNSKAEKILGWSPKIKLKETMTSIWNWESNK